MTTRTICILIPWLMALASAGAASAQPYLFGSVDDPEERGRRAPWHAESSVGVYGGVSLIGPQWNSSARILVQTSSRRYASKFSFVIRAGQDGVYDPDVDEAYDAVRLINHLRFQNESTGSYIRFGPLERTRLDLGQLANFHNTNADWNGRRLGVESSVSSNIFRLSGFADELDFSGIMGASLSFSPFGNMPNHPLRTVAVSVSGVTENRVDLPPDESEFKAYSVSGRFEAWRSGAFSLFPFLSYSRIESGGDGVMFGADASSDNFIDTARLHFRLAIHINSEGFTPGAIGPFWQIHNTRARIIRSDRESDDAPPILLGRDYITAPNNRVLETELRVLLFERFELWYRYMKNFDHPTAGQFNLRMYVRASQFRFGLSYDRGSVREFFALFDNLEDMTLVRFETSYRLFDFAWIFVEARYTYNHIPDSGAIKLYEVERRFDPLMGARIVF